MIVYPYQYINRSGIPTLKSTEVKVNGASSVDFVFDADIYTRPYRGLIVVYLAQAIPTGTTASLPIRLVFESTSSTVTTYDNAEYTVGDFNGTGVYLLYCDQRTNTLQLLN